jgi:hypothetical protein
MPLIFATPDPPFELAVRLQPLAHLPLVVWWRDQISGTPDWNHVVFLQRRLRDFRPAWRDALRREGAQILRRRDGGELAVIDLHPGHFYGRTRAEYLHRMLATFREAESYSEKLWRNRLYREARGWDRARGYLENAPEHLFRRHVVAWMHATDRL